MPLPALTMPSTLRTIVPTPSKGSQSRQGRARHQYHAPATTTIATIRATPRHVLLPAEAHHPVPASACLHLYLYPIEQQLHLTV